VKKKKSDEEDMRYWFVLNFVGGSLGVSYW